MPVILQVGGNAVLRAYHADSGDVDQRSGTMAITIPGHGDQCRSEATLDSLMIGD